MTQMLRFILLTALTAVVFFFVRRLLEGLTAPPRKATPPEYVQMVSCVTCGVHLPVGDAVRRGDHYFCSTAHAEHRP
jgi:uncharacterized protein